MPEFGLTIRVAASDGVVEMLDVTWQDAPEWRAGDRWTACWAPSLVSGQAPFPGVSVRCLVTTQRCVSVNVTSGAPDPRLQLVATHQLIFGSHGLGVETPSDYAALVIPEGLYRGEIRVNADEPSRVTEMQLRLVDHEPRGERGLDELRVAAEQRSA